MRNKNIKEKDKFEINVKLIYKLKNSWFAGGVGERVGDFGLVLEARSLILRDGEGVMQGGRAGGAEISGRQEDAITSADFI